MSRILKYGLFESSVIGKIERESVLDRIVDGKWEYAEDGKTVNVIGDVDVRKARNFFSGHKGLGGIVFGSVSGDFDCPYIYAESFQSLEGCPREVGGNFNCSNSSLKSLVGGPEFVGRDYDCSYNELESLEGAPKEIPNGSFYCSFNMLTTLKGSPEYVESTFNCGNNSLSSLVGGPKDVGNYRCSSNLGDIRYEGYPIVIRDSFYGDFGNIFVNANRPWGPNLWMEKYNIYPGMDAVLVMDFIKYIKIDEASREMIKELGEVWPDVPSGVKEYIAKNNNTNLEDLSRDLRVTSRFY
jgi:hypothetical protein